MDIKVIITGATGFVGEGVLLTCLEHPDVKQVLMVNRRHFSKDHSKLKECIIPDFSDLDNFNEQLTGYNACFFCAGVSSVGMNRKEYSHITYDLTLNFAGKLAKLNPDMVFIYVSGALTDSSENGKIMWARVKGKTENDLMKLPFKGEYNFRPALMRPMPGQTNLKGYYKIIHRIFPAIRFLFPAQVSTLQEVGRAMINCVLQGYSKQILEVKDINLMAKLQV